MKTILVTGATGFIGSTLVHHLHQKFDPSLYQVRVLTRGTSQLNHLLDFKYEQVKADLTSLESLKQAVDGVSVVFHVAGVVSARSREEFFRQNADNTSNLAEAIKQTRGRLDRFVYFSSLAAGGPMTIARERTEDDPDEPCSFYGESKLEAEQRLQAYSQYFPVTVLRPPMVYGPKDKGVFVFVKSAASGIMPIIAGDTANGEKYYSVIHSDDLCDLALRAAFADPGKRESFEVLYASGNGIYSFTEIYSAIKSGLGKRVLRVRAPKMLVRGLAQVSTLASKITRKTYPLTVDKLNELFADYWLCSNQKAKETLGFEPKIGLRDGFQNTVDWYRQQGWIPA